MRAPTWRSASRNVSPPDSRGPSRGLSEAKPPHWRRRGRRNRSSRTASAIVTGQMLARQPLAPDRRLRDARFGPGYKGRRNQDDATAITPARNGLACGATMGREARQRRTQALRPVGRTAYPTRPLLFVGAGPCDAPTVPSARVPTNETGRPCRRAYVRRRIRTLVVPPRSLLASRQPRALGRRSARSRGARARHDGDRVAARARGEPGHGSAQRTRARRALPCTAAAIAARSTPSTALCTAERAEAHDRQRPRDEPPPRSGLLCAMVRWVDARSAARNATHTRWSLLVVRRCAGEDLAAEDEMARSRATRSRRGAGLMQRLRESKRMLASIALRTRTDLHGGRSRGRRRLTVP